MNLKKMLVLTLAAGTLAFGASAVSTVAPANAHTPEASATCSTLTVDLKSYDIGNDGAFVNSIRVEIDSELVEEADFGTSLRETYPLGDQEVAHDYRVEVDARGTQYDREFTGTSVPCVKEPAPDAGAAVSVTPSTCDTNGTLVLGEITNATWGVPTATTGPGDYSVTATAVVEHVFPDGASTQTFTGTLEGMLDSNTTQCAVIVDPEEPAPSWDVVEESSLDCDAATQTTTTTTTTNDWLFDVATNTWVAAPAVVTTASATVAAPVGVCPQAEVVVPPVPAQTPPAPVIPPSTPADADVRAVPVESLASTGADIGVIAPIGAAILLVGAALLVAQRRGAKRAATRD